MPLHPETFEYLQPTADQVDAMHQMRAASKVYADHIEALVPEGPDKTYILRKLREVAMWVNIAITRHPNGAPRQEVDVREYPADHPVEGDLGSVPLT
jgi:hypothetical protein